MFLFLFAHKGGSDGEEWARMSELHMSDNDSDCLIAIACMAHVPACSCDGMAGRPAHMSLRWQDWQDRWEGLSEMRGLSLHRWVVVEEC